MNLQECPFCGSDGEVIKSAEGRTWYQPKCSRCDCIIDNGFRTEEGAAKEWNDRRSKALEWLKIAGQMAQQQANGGEDIPLHSAWQWLVDNIIELEA